MDKIRNKILESSTKLLFDHFLDYLSTCPVWDSLFVPLGGKTHCGVVIFDFSVSVHGTDTTGCSRSI